MSRTITGPLKNADGTALASTKIRFVAKVNHADGSLTGVSQAEEVTNASGQFSVDLLQGIYRVIVGDSHPVGEITVVDGDPITISELLDIGEALLKTNALEEFEQLADSAEASAQNAEHWASYPYDQEVPGGGGEKSAKHYAEKAAQSAAAVTNPLFFAGGHDASTGAPITPNSGEFPFYKITGAGTINSIGYLPGDSIVWDGSVWFKVDNTDPTAAEILAAVEAQSGRDMSADGSKLDGIESGATADQTPAEILSAVESESGRDMSADGVKLDSIEENAKDDQVAAEVPVTPSGNLSSSNAQDALVELQAAIDALTSMSPDNLIMGDYSGSAPLDTDGDDGDYAIDFVTGNVYGPKAGGTWPGTPVGDFITNSDLSYNRDANTVTITCSNGTNVTLPAATDAHAGVMSAADKAKLDGLESGATADQTPAEILSAVESESGRDISADGIKLDGLVPQSSAYDNTAGALLALSGTAGSFGLGASNLTAIADLNSPTTTRFDKIINTTSNRPFNFGVCLSIAYDANNMAQYAMATGSSEVWYRRKLSGTWQSWVQLLHPSITDNGNANAMTINADESVDFANDVFVNNGDLWVGSGAPRIYFSEVGGASGYDRYRILFDNGTLYFTLEDSVGGFVSHDYMVDFDASGAIAHRWRIGNADAGRFDSSRNFLVGKTSSGLGSAGAEMQASGTGVFSRSGNTCLFIDRLTNDGQLVDLRQDSTSEGNISVSGGTVSLTGAHLSRWSQWADGPHSEPPEVLRGTILSNTDEMCLWLAVEWEEVIPAEIEQVTHYKTKPVKKKNITHEVIDGKAVQKVEEVTVDEIDYEFIPVVDEQESPVIKDGKQQYLKQPIFDYVEDVERAPEQVVKHHELYDGPGEVGDVIDYTTESGEVVKATIVQEANEQLNKTLISSVAGDKSVGGVFQDYDHDDIYAPYDFYVAQVGDFVVRISKDVDPADLKDALIESNGDGTGRPQADDVRRSSTVAKVSSTQVIETYPDGSYIVPCLLMAC